MNLNMLKSLSTITFVPVMVLLIMLVFKSGGAQSGRLGGPFESSGSTSRYALTAAIVEDHTLYFSPDRAKFASPDVAKLHGHYFSLFPPGVSFVGVPFYWLGKQLGIPQLATYTSTLILAVFNAWLVVKLARKLGAGVFSSLVSGLLFLFATNALTYALTFTQHHLSTTLILLAMLSALGKRSWLNNLW